MKDLVYVSYALFRGIMLVQVFLSMQMLLLELLVPVV